MMAFIIWTVVTLVFVILGISTWKSKDAAGFFNVTEPPKIPKENIKAYNHSVAVIWFVFSGVFELLGVPLFLFEQNSPYFILTMIGSIFLIIGIIIAYLRVENKYS